MNKSEQINEIAKALLVFHKSVPKILKTDNNPFFNKKYAGLPSVLDSIHDPLQNSGLSFVQFPCGENSLTTLLMHGESGQWIEGTYEMKPTKNDPQGIGSCITYMRRYALASVLGLNIDEDDDGNGASGRNDNEKKPKTQQPTTAKTTLEKGSEAWTKVVNALTQKTATIEQVKGKYEVSPALETELNELVAKADASRLGGAK